MTKEKEIDIRQSDEDAFYEYKNDIALKIGIEYFILKGFHFELSYLRGFNRPLEFPFDNKMYNQAFLFNVGYQWKLFAQNRVK